MKNLWIVICLVCGILSVACSSEDEVTNEVNGIPETVEVLLSMSGDVMTTSDSPITRAGEAKKKVYGINVYYREGNDGDYNHYAYGLFDNVADMKISLISKYNYKFECTIVQDDYDELWYDANKKYSSPFSTIFDDYYEIYEKYRTLLSNKFNVSTTSTTYLCNIGEGQSYIKDGSSNYNLKNYPATDRLYGELSGYVPQANGTATISMKRTAFGAKFVVSPPSDGTLNISSDFCNLNVESGGEAKTIESLTRCSLASTTALPRHR